MTEQNTKIIEKLKLKVIQSDEPNVAEAWAGALKEYMIAVGIEYDLKVKAMGSPR